MKPDQLEELQTRLAYSEATIAQLDSALVDQQNRIELLESRIDALTAQVRDSIDGAEVEDHQPPPHY